jgi:hypothetical protein
MTAPPHVHPRRRRLSSNNNLPTSPSDPLSPQAPAPLAIPAHALRRGATFHSPSSPSSEHDPILHIPSLPRRSHTCAKDLEHLLAAVDDSLSGSRLFPSDKNGALAADGLPVPRFLLDHHAAAPGSDTSEDTLCDSPPPAQTHRRHHSSDSGIASSVSSSEPSLSPEHVDLKQGTTRESSTRNADSHASVTARARNRSDTAAASPFKAGRVQSGINGLPMSVPGSTTGSQQALSEYACKQIQKHIIIPILREEKLKGFRPLIQGIPYRVARKEITCLRDLERVLFYLAPVSKGPLPGVRRLVPGLMFYDAKKWSSSKDAFVNFCETSIQCIHATVDHLSEREQRRPTDRPYTNGYFVDLTEQVRQYASILAAERARMAEASDDTHPAR